MHYTAQIFRFQLVVKFAFSLAAFFLNGHLPAQPRGIGTVLVDQAGYNTHEAKRLVAWGIPDNTAFHLRAVASGRVVYSGKIENFGGDFTGFNPKDASEEYIAEVPGLKPSVPFRIAPFFHELLSSKLAYDFFVDVRGSEDPVHSNEAKVYGGGPSRDCGAYTLETVFETMLYASNPALFDRWTGEMGNGKMPDLVALILWHAEFAYHHAAYNGPVAERHGWLGYKDSAKMSYDYWNTLDQLAAVCAAYHSFLKPYLPEEKYKAYRRLCLEKWTAYDRHKVVRYWTYSTKWVDIGYQEFNEMGNAYGQSVFSNLFMYLAERNEKDGEPEKYLNWARETAMDIIAHWDFNNPRHMWWIRNAEHITPQALAFFLMVAPDKAPPGTRQKLNAWVDHILGKTANPWHYRVHSDTEWAHPKTKELGSAPALGGSLFAAAYLLKRPEARAIAWSQINFVFGLNPLGAHFSNKSAERLAIKGYWEGVEYGWPDAHPDGYGMLGRVRGTLDGTPLDKDFPRVRTQADLNNADTVTDQIGKNAYATEGWAISNRGWMATITFAALHSTKLEALGRGNRPVNTVKKGKPMTIQLRAPLNTDGGTADKAWVEVEDATGALLKCPLLETGPDTGVFAAEYRPEKSGKIKIGYGYWGFRKEVVLNVTP